MRLAVYLLLTLLSLAAQGRTVHREKSLYQDISVVEADGRRCLVFAAIRGDQNQTCQYLDSDKLVFPYVRMTFAGLLLNPEPQQILMVGLGGGTVPALLHRLYPKASLDVVEIDPAVVKVAKAYFGFKEAANMQVTVSDARVFVKRAGLKQAHYDLILLDAFNGDYIPEHLMTREFLEEVKALLSPAGVLVANTFSSSKLYHHESATYRAVFGPFLNFRQPKVTLSRVIIASQGSLPDPDLLQRRAEALAPRLAPYGIPLADYPALLGTDPDWDQDARVLTDQYAPANLLQRQ
ncbi:spermidine synthase [Gallaecimonas xiamenensis]|uniref:Polyamine aminopropyltransferase n=1 Tax=Gallaecimonas xiamenensis 3-C-1 TaxID=745411 RepID=K2J4A6_9GAMM|nr:fused MFS/spermidine synthase [Gallaecimonas xiamenensis]EKE77881.1 spermidine synthase [Gallaecimonas xiamenensis 3-C-1]